MSNLQYLFHVKVLPGYDGKMFKDINAFKIYFQVSQNTFFNEFFEGEKIRFRNNNKTEDGRDKGMYLWFLAALALVSLIFLHHMGHDADFLSIISLHCSCLIALSPYALLVYNCYNHLDLLLIRLLSI